jgi:flagellar protein FliO/FliZ
VLCLAALRALAQTAPFQTTPVETPGVSISSAFQMFFGLILVLALFFICAFLVRRFNGGKTFGRSGPLKILGGLAVGPRERILLVEIGESWLIIGIVPGQIKTLHTLPKGEFSLPETNEKPFAFWFRRCVGDAHEEQ